MLAVIRTAARRASRPVPVPRSEEPATASEPRLAQCVSSLRTPPECQPRAYELLTREASALPLHPLATLQFVRRRLIVGERADLDLASALVRVDRDTRRRSLRVD